MTDYIVNLDDSVAVNNQKKIRDVLRDLIKEQDYVFTSRLFRDEFKKVPGLESEKTVLSIDTFKKINKSLDHLTGCILSILYHKISRFFTAVLCEYSIHLFRNLPLFITDFAAISHSADCHPVETDKTSHHLFCVILLYLKENRLFPAGLAKDLLKAKGLMVEQKAHDNQRGCQKRALNNGSRTDRPATLIGINEAYFKSHNDNTQHQWRPV